MISKHKEQLVDSHAGVEIQLPDGSLLPQMKRSGRKKKVPVAHMSQLSHTIPMSIGDEQGKEKVIVDVPVDREGALMMCYGTACAMARLVEQWVSVTMMDMEKSGQIPNAQELKDMMTVVKHSQDVVMNTWSKVAVQSANRREAGAGIHAPMLNQFFKIENLITTEDGKAPSVEQVLKSMHDLKVTASKSVRQLEAQDKASKALGSTLGELEVVQEEDSDGEDD